jgi:hypothetical protein
MALSDTPRKPRSDVSERLKASVYILNWWIAVSFVLLTALGVSIGLNHLLARLPDLPRLFFAASVSISIAILLILVFVRDGQRTVRWKISLWLEGAFWQIRFRLRFLPIEFLLGNKYGTSYEEAVRNWRLHWSEKRG